MKELEKELEQVKAKLAELEAMMHIVNQKARIDRNLNDLLYGVIVRYRKYKRDSK
jgi:hypothetical protein